MLGEIQVNLYVRYDKSIRINYIIRSMLLWRECKGSYVHSLHVSVKITFICQGSINVSFFVYLIQK